MQANAIFRPAGPSDAPDLACLIDSASRGFALWIWTTLRSPGQTVLEVARNRILNERASPLHYAGFTVVEVDGVVAGALTGRLIPVPHQRGDAADLPDLLVPLLELEAVAAGTWYLEHLGGVSRVPR